MITILRAGLFIADIFVAITAIGGGIALFSGLESAERIPPSWLDGTPFSSYVIPGLILAVVVGGSAAIAAYATYDSRSAGGIASILAGALLMGYIIVEVAILNQPTLWTQTEIVFFAIGFLIVLLGMAVWRL